MPFNTSPTDVRELAGGVLAADFSDAEIIEEQEAGKDIIEMKTGREWSTQDGQFELIVRIENALAAALVLAHFGPQHKDESERLWTRAMQLLDIVTSSQLEGLTDTGVMFSSSKYMSHILGRTEDPNLDVYRSTWISKARGNIL